MIERLDVIQVADSINVSLTESEVSDIIIMYPSEALNVPSATWDLIVENIIYNIKK